MRHGNNVSGSLMTGITRKQFLSLPAFSWQGASRPKNVLLLMADEHKPHALGIDGDALANIGKLHAVDGQTHGFDYFLENKDWLRSLGSKIALWHEDSDKSVDDGRKGALHVGRAAKLPEEDHFESFVARESIKFLKNHGKRPFFLVTSFVKPHD